MIGPKHDGSVETAVFCGRRCSAMDQPVLIYPGTRPGGSTHDLAARIQSCRITLSSDL